MAHKLVALCLVLVCLGLFYHPYSWKYLRRVTSDELDEDDWKDDLWPLRPQFPWDISTDFPYPRTLEYDVTEGTWLRLDVHPKTGDIVFDMAGDLYCLPQAAYRENAQASLSQAHPILRGVPQDSDPHFSPEGDRLAFRSDAGLGIENIWLMVWKGCEGMSLDRQDDPPLFAALEVRQKDRELLALGQQETEERRYRRLLLEGRLDALQVTNETYRSLTDPRFHPSGKTLVATKWYSSRSIPGGEGWEYDLPSLEPTKTPAKIPVASGRRIVGRPKLPGQTTLAEFDNIAVGPEQFIWWGEEALIYSQNVIDVGMFEYSKDVHQGIYSIFSYNITTKQTTTLVSSFPGGASRPELSRDQRTLAFVRRVRDKEALVLKDLVTGTIHHVWYGLTYDLSMISAPMGTYPSFAFAPEDDAIIIWAAGQIYEVPLALNAFGERIKSATSSPRPIRFTARISKQLAGTRRGASDLNLRAYETEDSVRIHAFKDMRIDYNGKRALVQGAGRTYLHSISENKTSELQTAHSTSPYLTPEFAASPTGSESWIINTRWSDTSFSSFELVDLECGAVYEIKGIPLGRNWAPTLSHGTQSSRTLAFIKKSNEILTGDIVATAQPGIYTAKLNLPIPCPSYPGPRSLVASEITFIPSDIVTTPPFKMRFASERSQLKFTPDNKQLLVQQDLRVFTVDLEGEVDILGRRRHITLARGEMTDELTLSSLPTHSRRPVWAAFVDFYHVYVAPLPSPEDPPLWTKPGKATKGVMRLSVNGGHDLAWSGDGKTLFWLSGPVLHSLDVSKLDQCKDAAAEDGLFFGISCTKHLVEKSEIFAHFEGDVPRLRKEATLNHRRASLSPSGENQEEMQHSFDAEPIGFQVGKDADVLVVVNANIISMDPRSPRKVIQDAAVVVRGGVFTYVGPSSGVPSFHGAKIIDAHGGYITPGFIDMHAHWIGFAMRFPATSYEMANSLAFGITTLHNPSGHDVDSPLERGRIERGQMPGPRIFTTGNIIYGDTSAGGHQDIVNMDEAYEALWRIKVEAGPVGISYKNYIIHSRASRQRLLLAARDLNMSCVPEGGMNSDWDLTYIIDGMTTLEHAYPIPTLYDDILTLFAKSGTGYTPTHMINYGGVIGEQYVWAEEDLNNNEKLRRFMRHDFLEKLSESTSRPLDSYALFNTSASAAKMVRLGLRTHIGAHGEAPQGFGYHYEMFFTQQGGLTNYETLRAATYDAAATLGLEDSLGSIAETKLADFLIYPAGVDLLEGDLRNTLQLSYTVRGGRVWESDTMTEVWPLQNKKLQLPPLNPD